MILDCIPLNLYFIITTAYLGFFWMVLIGILTGSLNKEAKDWMCTENGLPPSLKLSFLNRAETCWRSRVCDCWWCQTRSLEAGWGCYCAWTSSRQQPTSRPSAKLHGPKGPSTPRFAGPECRWTAGFTLKELLILSFFKVVKLKCTIKI